jgi:hypothetical protein
MRKTEVTFRAGGTQSQKEHFGSLKNGVLGQLLRIEKAT